MFIRAALTVPVLCLLVAMLAFVLVADLVSNTLKHCRCSKPDPAPMNDRNQICRNCGGWFTLVFRSLKEMAEVRAIMQAEVDEIKSHAREPDT